MFCDVSFRGICAALCSEMLFFFDNLDQHIYQQNHPYLTDLKLLNNHSLKRRLQGACTFVVGAKTLIGRHMLEAGRMSEARHMPESGLLGFLYQTPVKQCLTVNTAICYEVGRGAWGIMYSTWNLLHYFTP